MFRFSEIPDSSRGFRRRCRSKAREMAVVQLCWMQAAVKTKEEEEAFPSCTAAPRRYPTHQAECRRWASADNLIAISDRYGDRRPSAWVACGPCWPLRSWSGRWGSAMGCGLWYLRERRGGERWSRWFTSFIALRSLFPHMSMLTCSLSKLYQRQRNCRS